MVGLAVVALMLRLWFVLSVGQTPTNSFSDPSIYNAIATGLARGQGYIGIAGHATAQFPPGYPFLLAFAYSLFGIHPTAGAIFNAVLGAATVPLLYFVARRTLGRVEAIVVGVGMTLLLGQIFYTSLLMSETLFTFLLAVVLVLLVVLRPERIRSAVLIGLVLGAATLTHGEGLLLITVALAMWWSELPRRVLRRQGAIMLGVAIACLIPWTIRNANAMHSFVPLSTNLGATLWAGHNPRTYGGPQVPPQQLLSSIRAPTGTPAYELAENTLLKNKALSWMAGHPFDELGLIPLKLIALFGGDGQAIAYWFAPQGGKALLSAHAQFRLNVLANAGTYFLLGAFLASLAVFGKALWRRRPILRGALVFLAISAVLYGFLFFGGFRYLVPLEPLMLLVAAPLVAQLWSLRARRFG